MKSKNVKKGREGERENVSKDHSRWSTVTAISLVKSQTYSIVVVGSVSVARRAIIQLWEVLLKLAHLVIGSGLGRGTRNWFGLVIKIIESETRRSTCVGAGCSSSSSSSSRRDRESILV